MFLNFLKNPIPKEFYLPWNMGVDFQTSLYFLEKIKRKKTFQGKFQGSPIVIPIPILLPYHTHKNPLKYGNGMGSLWEGGPTVCCPWRNPSCRRPMLEELSTQKVPHE